MSFVEANCLSIPAYNCSCCMYVYWIQSSSEWEKGFVVGDAGKKGETKTREYSGNHSGNVLTYFQE